MSIGIYIIIVLAVILIGWLIVFAFDYLLARGAFRLIIGKAKEHLDAEKLKVLLQKYMENRRQKWAFKAYMGCGDAHHRWWRHYPLHQSQPVR